MTTAHQHRCACGTAWWCTKPACDIPTLTECSLCAQRQMEDFAVSTGWVQPPRLENARATYLQAVRQMNRPYGED